MTQLGVERPFALFFISPIALHAVVCFGRTTFGSFTTGFDEMALIKPIGSLFQATRIVK